MPNTPKKLWNNLYFALRHAESTANAQGIILSDPANGIGNYGLTDTGRAQIAAVDSNRCRAAGLELSKVVCITSDFKRAIETAQAFCSLHSIAPPVVDERLRERNFGVLEKESNKRYEEVWAYDEDSMDHTEFEVESLIALQTRIDAMLTELDSKYSDQHIILSSHGDTLQITQCIFQGVSPKSHRSLPHLGNAELRLLNS